VVPYVIETAIVPAESVEAPVTPTEGATGGRLTVWTESALAEVADR